MPALRVPSEFDFDDQKHKLVHRHYLIRMPYTKFQFLFTRSTLVLNWLIYFGWSSRALDKVWHMPLDDNSAKKMQEGFKQLVGDRAIGRTILKEGTRTIEGIDPSSFL